MDPVVLVVLGRTEAVCACLDAGAYAAAVLGGGRIVVLATRVASEATVLPSEEVLTAARRAELDRRAVTAIAALHRAFVRWDRTREPSGIAAEWVVAEGTIEVEVSRHGRAVEVVAVAARPSREDRTGATLRAALLGTDRPVLVVPDRLGGSIGRRITIAWHDDEPAIRAVLSAMPFLAVAEQVWVMRGGRAGGQPNDGLPPILVEHGIRAELRAVVPTGGTIGDALIAEAHALGSDLLVMGAYRHHPLLEAVLGGVTRTMLNTTDIPLLMHH